MDSTQTPSPNRLVVQVQRNEEDIGRKLGELGELQKLKGSDGLLLLQVDEKSGLKGAWDRARKMLGANGTVQPVLLHEDGSEHYPTGQITVRFKTNPSDATLERFAAEHSLRLCNRNEYVPQQVVLEPLGPSEPYIPDLVEKIQSSKDVQMTWANTLSRYTRL